MIAGKFDLPLYIFLLNTEFWPIHSHDLNPTSPFPPDVQYLQWSPNCPNYPTTINRNIFQFQPTLWHLKPCSNQFQLLTVFLKWCLELELLCSKHSLASEAWCGLVEVESCGSYSTLLKIPLNAPCIACCKCILVHVIHHMAMWTFKTIALTFTWLISSNNLRFSTLVRFIWEDA